jgi:autophagy-related protein 18
MICRVEANEGLADGAIAICEMLFQTSLVALVGIGDEPTMSPRRLQIINTKVSKLNFLAVTLYVVFHRSLCGCVRETKVVATPGDL